MKLAALVGILLLACSSKPKALTCERAVIGPKLEAGTVLWFGEMHGTEESPRFVGDVACHAAKKLPVQLGLEIWRSEQTTIDKYLASSGSKTDRDALLAGPFWNQKDGRTSVAMVALIETVRKLRASGAKISIVAYDNTHEPDRDLAMAKFVIAARDPKAQFVGLSGNIHSRKEPWNELTPLVKHLIVEGQLSVHTHDVSAKGGTFWGCVGTSDHEPVCGEHPMSDDGENGKPWSIGGRRDKSHDALYYVGVTKASPPVRP